MLGLSLGKLLVLATIIAIVWYGFKYVKRVEEVRRVLRRERERRRQAARPGPQTLEAEDLVKCRKCGAYVPARSTTSCGRPDCLWGQ